MYPPRTHPTPAHTYAYTLKRTWIARCPDCKAHRRLATGTKLKPGEFSGFIATPIVRCTCGCTMIAKPLKARTSDHTCGARCRSSTGHVCACSCNGKNHGVNA